MTKKKDTKRVVPKRNYVILLLNFIVSGVIFWLLVEPFKKEEKQESKLTDKLVKLDYSAFGEFIVERQDVIVYLTDFSDKSLDFEDSFEDIIAKEDLAYEVVYVNTSTLTSEDLLNVKNTYYSDKLKSSNVGLNVVPNLLVFQDGKVVDILYKVESAYTYNEMVIFLENYGVIYND